MTLTPEQITARRDTCGSSDVAALLGLNPYWTQAEVIAEKKGFTDPEFSGNEATDYGDWMEPVILARYAAETDATVVPNAAQFHHAEHSWMTATPDAFAGDGSSRWIIEAKTAGSRQVDRWGPSETEEIPDEYRLQIVWQMAICDVDRVDVAAIVDRSWRRYTFRRHAELERRIIAKVARIWDDHVIGHEPLPADGHVATSRFLAHLFASASEEMIDATTDDDDIAAQWLQAQRDMRYAAERMERLKQLVQLRIGDRKGIAGHFGKIQYMRPSAGCPNWKDIALELEAPPELVAKHMRPAAPYVRPFWRRDYASEE